MTKKIQETPVETTPAETTGLFIKNVRMQSCLLWPQNSISHSQPTLWCNKILLNEVRIYMGSAVMLTEKPDFTALLDGGDGPHCSIFFIWELCVKTMIISKHCHNTFAITTTGQKIIQLCSKAIIIIIIIIKKKKGKMKCKCFRKSTNLWRLYLHILKVL